MKKRLISMALAVSMAVNIMPAPALATVGGGTTLGDDAITLSDATGGTSSGTATPVSDLTGILCISGKPKRGSATNSDRNRRGTLVMRNGGASYFGIGEYDKIAPMCKGSCAI